MKLRATLAVTIAAALALAGPSTARALDPLATFDTAPKSKAKAKPRPPEEPASGTSSPGDAPPRPAEPRPVERDPVRFVVQLGADFGLTTAIRVDFYDGSSQSLKFNQGASVGAGLSVPTTPDGMLSTQAVIGVEYSTVSASNLSLTWLTFPLEVMEVVNAYPFRFGVGLSCLLAPSIKGTGSASAIDAKFKTSFGLLAEADLTFRNEANPRRPSWWLGVRYELQKVEAEAGGTSQADAVGVVLGAAL